MFKTMYFFHNLEIRIKFHDAMTSQVTVPGKFLNPGRSSTNSTIPKSLITEPPREP